ncbi:hypothetical protein LZ554_007018 [Drepanopeziza brunnea f. sp. 'monogermtubi']|nr:hypothetical protein LZ554_007018 [Drepanopeziza brunnea f. sp. 'monogermtubi']
MASNMNMGAPSELKPRPLPKPPTYCFVTITDPKETKSRSKKRQVRSAVAYYQHHKDDGKDPGSGRRMKGWKRKSVSRSLVTSLALEQDDSGEKSSSSTQPTPTPPEKMPDYVSGFHTSYQPAFSGMRVDPFQSYPIPWDPVYEPILDFYLTHVLIDTPGIAKPGQVFRLRSSWYPFIMKSPITFYAALALAGTLFYSRCPHPATGLTMLGLRQKAISSINSTLSDPDTCKSDETIGAVFCMSLLESMHGDANSYQVHMAGLAKMVRMRGGLGELGLDGLMKKMICWLDFKHTKVHGSDLAFGESREVEKRASPFKHPKEGAERRKLLDKR